MLKNAGDDVDHGRRRTIVTIFLLSALSFTAKLLGFVREQIIASRFGVSAVTDAYASAALMPALLDSVIGGAMSSVLVPIFTESREQTQERLERLLFSVTVVFGGLYALETLLLWLGAPILMRLLVPGLQPGVMEQGIGLARLFAPIVFLSGVSAMLTALLSVHKQFLLPGVAALSANLTIMVVALTYRGNVTAEHLAGSISVGYALQLTIVTINVLVCRIRWRPSSIDWEQIRQVLLLSLPLLFANTVGLVTPMVDKFLASGMTEGSIAALNYATKLIQLPVSVMVMGLSTVLYSRFAKLTVDGQLENLATEVGRTVQGLFFIMLPGTALVIALAEPLVALTFMRGSFDQLAVNKTGIALVYYAVGLLPMAALPILTRVLFSLKQTRAQLYSIVSSTLVYVGAAWALSPLMGHRGLALAFALGQIAYVAVTGLFLHRSLGSRPWLIASKSLPSTVAASLGAFAAAAISARYFIAPMTTSLAGGVAGLFVYLLVHKVMRTEEWNWVVSGLQLARQRWLPLRTP